MPGKTQRSSALRGGLSPRARRRAGLLGWPRDGIAGRPVRGTLDVAIVGYGTAGQTAGRLLQRHGHRLEIFERASRPRPVGAGLLLQPTGLCVLAELGLLDGALDCGEPIHRLLGETVHGRRVIDMDYAGLGAGWSGLGIQRGALFESCAIRRWNSVCAAVRVSRAWMRSVESCVMNPAGVTALTI